jgi:hypothetical protein
MRQTAPLQIRVASILGACLLLAACASTSHVTAFQEAPLAPTPRVLTLALQDGESLPFGITADAVAAAAAGAGYVLGGDHPRYRLALTAASGASDSASYLPGAQDKASHNWVARSDRSWRARFAGGRVLRVSAVLIDMQDNREVWRGTGTLRTADPKAAARELMAEVLAQLPRG